MNRDLNESTLENAYGGPIKVEDLPEKFKPTKPQEEEELTPEAMEKLYGGPIKVENLPEGTYVDKGQELETRSH